MIEIVKCERKKYELLTLNLFSSHFTYVCKQKATKIAIDNLK